MAKKAGWLRRAVGEISKLREEVYLRLGSLFTAYKLDSSRVKYALARQLYENSNDNYKLGAGFAKPIIDTAVGWMGVPRFKSEDKDAQEALDKFQEENVSKMQQVHMQALRDGDAWVYITREEITPGDAALYPEAKLKARIRLNILPPEQVTQILRDPFTARPVEYTLTSKHEWLDTNGQQHRGVVEVRIRAENILTTVIGDAPPGVEAGNKVNPWGFIPIVQFSNERDSSSENGRSELEPVEPFLKAYHDVMLAAIQGNQMHSTPRLKIKTSNIKDFLARNFGVTDQQLKSGEASISLNGHEVLLFAPDEDAGFIEVASATGDAKDVLQLLFYCIVDTSQTPEFAFGVHTPSSLSSVQEQMPVLVRRIARKREHFVESWQMVARIYLTMMGQAENIKYSTHATTLIWDEIDPRDPKEVADELNIIVTALSTALTTGLIGLESAVNFLARYIETMDDYENDDPENPGEREKIMRTKLLMARLEDGQAVDDEKSLIQEALKQAAVATPQTVQNNQGGNQAPQDQGEVNQK